MIVSHSLFHDCPNSPTYNPSLLGGKITGQNRLLALGENMATQIYGKYLNVMITLICTAYVMTHRDVMIWLRRHGVSRQCVYDTCVIMTWQRMYTAARGYDVTSRYHGNVYVRLRRYYDVTLPYHYNASLSTPWRLHVNACARYDDVILQRLLLRVKLDISHSASLLLTMLVVTDH